MKNETGINPLNDRVLVRPDVIAKKNSVGVLVDTKAALAKPVYGTVLAVGTKPMKEKFFVEPGDRVCINSTEEMNSTIKERSL